MNNFYDLPDDIIKYIYFYVNIKKQFSIVMNELKIQIYYIALHQCPQNSKQMSTIYKKYKNTKTSYTYYNYHDNDYYSNILDIVSSPIIINESNFNDISNITTKIFIDNHYLEQNKNTSVLQL